MFIENLGNKQQKTNRVYSSLLLRRLPGIRYVFSLSDKLTDWPLANHSIIVMIVIVDLSIVLLMFPARARLFD